jgi:plastocyanin
LIILAIVPAVTALAAAPIVVNQVRRAFSVHDLHISRGETIRFNNIDEFLHQLYISSPLFKFSSSEQPPGQAVDITFSTAGTFDVKCEIHPKMSMTVLVE